MISAREFGQSLGATLRGSVIGFLVGVLPGAGGTTAVFVTAQGVVLVDTKLANNGQAILDQGCH